MERNHPQSSQREEGTIPCPHCDRQFELHQLIPHLTNIYSRGQPRPAVCPVCSDFILSSSMVTHISRDHAEIFNMLVYRHQIRRGRFLIDIPTRQTDSNETSTSTSRTVSNLLRQSVSNVLRQTASNDTSSQTVSNDTSSSRVEPSLTPEQREARTRRAAFAQDLFLSALLDD